jgi:hypothetical protein
MAGVKVTDLTTLGTAASDDIMYIVDTSTNTSKQIEVQDIYSGMPQLDSGTYTATVANETGGTVDATNYEGIYSRVGNVVTFTIPIDITMGGGSSAIDFNLSIPIASAFANQKQAYGVCAGNVEIATFEVRSDDGTFGTAGDIQITLNTNTAAISLPYFTITVQYFIV